MKSMYDTRHTLLNRATDPNNQQAWLEFVETYQRFIFYILNQVGVPYDDVEDVAQQILLTLTSDLAGYDQGRAKFRTWLSSVIRHAALAHLKKMRRREKHVANSQEPETESYPEPSELDRLIETEWMTYIANVAMERVRDCFQGQAMRVFELGLKDYSVEEIAKLTGLTTASVYTLRKRVKKRLYLEVRAVTNELEP